MRLNHGQSLLYEMALDLKVDHRNASKPNYKEKWGFYTMTFKKIIIARVQQPINANLIHNKKTRLKK